MTNSADVNSATTVDPARALERSSVFSNCSGLPGVNDVKSVVFMGTGLKDVAAPQPAAKHECKHYSAKTGAFGVPGGPKPDRRRRNCERNYNRGPVLRHVACL